MFETVEVNGLLPENDIDVNHVTTFKKSCWQQYKHSLQSSSNITSMNLLKCTWDSNKELFNDKAINHIINSANALLQNADTSQMKTWKSCLNTIDVESMFKQSMPKCIPCSSNSNPLGLDKFYKNKCTCDTGILNINERPPKETMNRGNSFFDRNFNSEHSSQESKSGDERQVFKPKFGRSRTVHKSSIQPITNPVIPEEFSLNKEEEENKTNKGNMAKATFKTAKEQLLASNPGAKRTLGTSRKAQAKFVSPMIGALDKQEPLEPEITDERLKHIDPKMKELIESEIIDKGTPIGWDDIAGLHLAKSVIQEAVVWPLLRPDIFTGLRRPPKGILLFGPPGTGKTLIGKCVAAQCNATFFSISASSLTSKWIGDGEKMVRALFAVARCHQPAVIFIDEIDSLLTQRSDTEHEATRRIKTEFLVQFDGAATGEEDRLLIVGATNRPQELDEAARRRLVKRLYIPLPDAAARQQIIANLLKDENNNLTSQNITEVANLTEGYSGADMKSLCSEAAMGPIRSVPLSQIVSIDRNKARQQIIANLLKDENNNLTSQNITEVANLTEGYSGADMKSLCSEAAMGPIRSVPLSQIVSIDRNKVRPVNFQDFINALQRVRPSVSQDDLGQYIKWNKTYGQGF